MESIKTVKPDSKVSFGQLDYDLLERSLQSQDSSEMVFQTLSIWLWGHLNVEFVAFYFTDSATAQYVKTKNTETSQLPLYEDIRKERVDSKVAKKDIFLHSDGFYSIPFDDFKDIYQQAQLLIGKDLDTGKPITLEDYSNFNPVIRILSKALLFFEAEALHEERNRLQYAFSRYVSPDLVQSIMSNDKAIQVGGEKQYLSVVFTDLRNFTPLTESMEPAALIRILNMYLNEMTQVIVALGGTIDKFEGDAIMAFFGAPHKLKDHAIRCCLAALRMKRMEYILNEQLINEKIISEPLFTRIGINSGDMIVGNIGSLQRLDYTIIGPNVNIASRIEDANKRYNTSILISGETFRLVAPYFNCQYCDTTYLKGVKKQVALYELLSERKDINFNYSNYEDVQTADSVDEVEDLYDESELQTI